MIQIDDLQLSFHGTSLSGGTVYAVYVVPTAYLFSMDRNYSYSVDMNPYWDSMSENMYESLKIDGEHAVNEIKEMGATLLIKRIGIFHKILQFNIKYVQLLK